MEDKLMFESNIYILASKLKRNRKYEQNILVLNDKRWKGSQYSALHFL
jgi:hypothetical protein